MVLLDCGSGLRRGELIGLKWSDTDFVKKQMDVSRSVVEMVVGDVKTEASKKAVPLDDFMIQELLVWYSITLYKKAEDLVLASGSPRAGAERRQAAVLVIDARKSASVTNPSSILYVKLV